MLSVSLAGTYNKMIYCFSCLQFHKRKQWHITRDNLLFSLFSVSLTGTYKKIICLQFHKRKQWHITRDDLLFSAAPPKFPTAAFPSIQLLFTHRQSRAQFLITAPASSLHWNEHKKHLLTKNIFFAQKCFSSIFTQKCTLNNEYCKWDV